MDSNDLVALLTLMAEWIVRMEDEKYLGGEKRNQRKIQSLLSQTLGDSLLILKSLNAVAGDFVMQEDC